MFKTTLTTLLAFAAGIAGAIIVAHRPPVTHGGAAAALEQEGDAVERRAELVAVAAAGARRMSELETEVARLKAREAAPTAPAETAPLRSPQEDHEREVVAHEALIDAHHAASRDGAWADAHETALRDNYRAAAEKLGFEVGSVDCRTSSCLVDVRFSSTTAALTNLGAVVGLHDPTCGARVTLPDAPTVDAPLTAQVYIDCPREAAAPARRT